MNAIQVELLRAYRAGDEAARLPLLRSIAGIAFIGSTYGLRRRSSAARPGWRSSSSSRLDDREHGGDGPPCSAESASQNRSRLGARRARARRTPRRSRSSTSRASSRGSRASARKNGHSRVEAPQPGEPLAVEPVGVRAPRRSRTRPAAGSGSASRRTPRGSRAAPASSPVAAASGREAGPRADLEQRQLVDRREAAEEGGKRGVVPDERAVGGVRDARPARPSCPARRRSAARGRRRRGTRSAASPRRPPRGSARARPGQAVLERDRLALLGQLQPAVDRARRLGEDRRVGRAAAAARASRRGRGRRQLDAARRPRSASSSSWAR